MHYLKFISENMYSNPVEGILFTLTSVVDFIGMVVALWLALYLFGRGFRSRITLRAVIVLLALSAFFLGAYINLHIQTPGTAAVRATLLITGLVTWHDLTHILLPESTQKKLNWLVAVIYALGLVTIILLLGTRNAFIGEIGNVLWVARMGVAPPYVIYGISQIAASAAILFNFAAGAKVGMGPQNRYFLISSILAASTVGYGVFALAISPPMPRAVQDGLILSSIVLLGVSVARHQTLVERRATLKDFPISALAVFGLSSIYIFMAWALGCSAIMTILVASLAVLTHSTYNLVREFLDRLRSKDENEYRRQLRRLETDARLGIPLRTHLQEGLRVLCQILEASGGFIAVRGSHDFIVTASHHSLPCGKRLTEVEFDCEDICSPPEEIAEQAAWVAPAFGGGKQVAVVGINAPRTRLHYSDSDLDLLAEAADRIGVIVYLYNLQPLGKDRLSQISHELQNHEAELQAGSRALMNTLVINPDPQFIKMVEDGFRHLADYISLGQSALTESLGIYEGTHIEKGKAVRQRLVEAVETLRPAERRPAEPLPREWYSYAVLHDAYIEEVPNREIMARLYISEGTFNRSRQKALRGIARFLME